MVLMLLLACAPTGPGEVVIAPDEARDGLDGAEGPYGAAWLPVRVQARVDGAVDAEVVFPSDASGEPLDGPFPALIFVQGGLVTPERYRWISAHAATRGYVGISAQHKGDLAIFEADNGRFALEGVEAIESGTLAGLLEPGADAVVTGHSLGGVVAPILWVDDPRMVGMAIIASYAANSTPVEERTDSLTLSLTGAEDGSALREDVEEGWERLGGQTWLGVVEGMNHFNWTDDATAENLEGDGVATRPEEETRRDAMRVFDAWMDASFGDEQALDALNAGEFSGVEWRQ